VDIQGTMKMSRAMVVPSEDETDEETMPRHNFMILISLQSDMTHIHTKTGFTAVGD
jgi:hypothetical protein